MNTLENIKKIHLIGIGGIGISALAHILLSKGKHLTGNDIEHVATHAGLIDKGVEIAIGDSIELIPGDVDAIVYSVAWEGISPKLMEAVRETSIPLFTYPQMLGIVSEEYLTIGISGTHGKTTTTAMTAKILIDAVLDPTVIVGGVMAATGSNFRKGASEYLVVEAGEYRGAFLNLAPSIVAITNIDNDHLDYFNNLKDIQKTFKKFVKKVPDIGYIICNPHDPNVKPAIKRASGKIIDYTTIDVSNLNLQVPSDYNKKNAQVALAIAQVLGLDLEHARDSLEKYTGTKRRFEYIGTTPNQIPVYDDYAHHPTEIQALLSGAKKIFPDKKIIAVFQPHLYSRTKTLLDDFTVSFAHANEVYILPIYPAREAPDPEISSSILVDKINSTTHNAINSPSSENLVSALRTKGNEDAIIFTIGAGMTDKIAVELVR